MKFKKLSLGLGLVFGAFAVASLTSCSGSTKVTYKDEAGNEKTVDVKKTNNKDEVAEAATAIVYSEGDKTFKPTGVSVSVSADAKVSGKYDSKAFNYSANASAKFMASIGTKYDAKDMVTYAEASVKASLPFDAIMAAMSKEDTVDYSKTSDLEVSLKEYSDYENDYVKLEKFTLPENDSTKTIKTIVDPLVGKLYKVDAKSLINMASGMLPSGVIPSSATSAITNFDKEDLQAYLDQYKAMENPLGSLSALLTSTIGVESEADFKTKVGELVTTYDISIDNVSGSNVKFKVGAKAFLGSDYTGSSYVAVTIDAAKKIPVALECDLADAITYSMNKNEKDEKLTEFKVNAAKVSLSISFNPTVPTLTDAEKKDAKDLLTALAGIKF